MIRIPSLHRRARGLRVAALTFVLAGLPSGHVVAADLVGLYAGGAIGQSQVKASAPAFAGSDFKENHSAFKVMVGLRPLSPVGAEIAYVDLGHPRGSVNFPASGGPVDVTMKGTAAFGILYVPLPVPVLDVYAKVGVAHLQSTVNYSLALGRLCIIQNPNCNAFRLDRTNTSFAAGAGAQLKFGSWAVRAEYERFKGAGGNPGLASLGLTWTFL
jgi:opacity protein-like surface antigen